MFVHLKPHKGNLVSFVTQSNIIWPMKSDLFADVFKHEISHELFTRLKKYILE